MWSISVDFCLFLCEGNTFLSLDVVIGNLRRWYTAIYRYISSSYSNKSTALCPLGIPSPGVMYTFPKGMTLFFINYSQSSLNEDFWKAERYIKGQTSIRTHLFQQSVERTVLLHYYRPWSSGDNTFGSVHVFVCVSELSCLNLGVFVCHHIFFHWRVEVDYSTWKHKISTLLKKL